MDKMIEPATAVRQPMTDILLNAQLHINEHLADLLQRLTSHGERIVGVSCLQEEPMAEKGRDPEAITGFLSQLNEAQDETRSLLARIDWLVDTIGQNS